MMKGCCMLTSCFKKKPLLDDQYGDIQEGHIKYLENEVRFKNEINDLTNMVEQSKVIIKDYEIELDELRYKLANIPPRTITEEITKCKRVSNCQHDTCDFGPMVKTIKQVRADCQSYSEQYSSIIDEHFPKIKKRDDQIQKLKHVLNGRNKEIEEKLTVVEAWYTPQIPVSQGPAEYWGLPGLILEVSVDNTTLLCTEIVINQKENTDIEAPSKGTEITKSDYTITVREKMVEMRNNRMGRRG